MEIVAVFSNNDTSLSRLVVGEDNIKTFISHHTPKNGELRKFTSIEEAEQAWENAWNMIAKRF